MVELLVNMRRGRRVEARSWSVRRIVVDEAAASILQVAARSIACLRSAGDAKLFDVDVISSADRSR